MLTRSQTIAANNFFGQIEESVSRKTRAIRRDSYASFVIHEPVKKEHKVPQNLFTIIRTRSQSKMMDRKRYDTYAVDIDFDDASREWKKNKRSLGNGTYEYKPDTLGKTWHNRDFD